VSGRRPVPEALVRTAHLVSLDATNLVRRLDERQLEMVSAFSRLRDREALLGAMRNYGLSARFEDVAVLPVPAQEAVVAFYERVDELRWYFQFTTDMPGTLAETFTLHRRRLKEAHEQLSAALVAATEPAAASLPARKPPRRRAARTGA
jgi:hypothetical protein